MKAIIIAAGKSTRLLPLTKDIPQPMLKIGSKTILERQIEFLKEAGVKDAIVITGYLSKKLEEFCRSLGIKTLFNPFYNVSGIALNLWIAKEELKNGFLFFYSDVLFDLEIIKGLLQTQKDICLAIKKNGFREEAERVVEKEGTIKNVSKDKLEEENGEFIGIAKFSDVGAEKIIKEIGSMSRDDLDISFINVIDSLARKEEEVSTYDIKDAQFIDIDFPQDLEKARHTIKNNLSK